MYVTRCGVEEETRNDPLRSSYKENNYGKLFESLSTIHQPKVIVECGVLDGYSLVHLARGCPDAQVWGFDLFGDYEYTHGDYEVVLHVLLEEFDSRVKLVRKNSLEAAEQFEDGVVDMLHLDISNDGEKLQKLFDVWDAKLRSGGLLIFEGGSPERDENAWMLKYNRLPIRCAKSKLSGMKYEYVTLLPYPSITICRKA